MRMVLGVFFLSIRLRYRLRTAVISAALPLFRHKIERSSIGEYGLRVAIIVPRAIPLEPFPCRAMPS
jgi:hypothetical protein